MPGRVTRRPLLECAMTIANQFRPSKPLPACQDWHPFKAWAYAGAREYEDFVDRIFDRDQGGFTRSDVFIDLLLTALERARVTRAAYKAASEDHRTIAL